MSGYIKIGGKSGKRGVGRPKVKKEDKKYTLFISVNGMIAQKAKEAFNKTEYKHMSEFLNELLVPELIKKLKIGE